MPLICPQPSCCGTIRCARQTLSLDDARGGAPIKNYAENTRLLFTCGPQSGRTSAPIIPHRVQTIREHRERTGISSGSQSPIERGRLCQKAAGKHPHPCRLACSDRAAVGCWRAGESCCSTRGARRMAPHGGSRAPAPARGTPGTVVPMNQPVYPAAVLGIGRCLSALSACVSPPVRLRQFNLRVQRDNPNDRSR
jgi:hypothetical protein